MVIHANGLPPVPEDGTLQTITKTLAALAFAALLSTGAGAQILVDHTCVDADRIPQAYLDLARQYDIFFCHASVGGTVTNGMGRLETGDPVRYGIDMAVNVAATWFDTNDGLLHLDYGGSWMSPSKIEGFANKIRNEGYDRAHLAFMKFCYIDWGAQVDAQQRWIEYRDMMEALEADFPDTTFVWWTSALNNNGEWGEKRSIFDNNMREYCAANGKVLFDLAAIESHDPNGNMALDDNGFEALYAAYASDGQHPNNEAGSMLAGGLWWLLARVAGWDVSPTRLVASSDKELLGMEPSASTLITVQLHDEVNDLFVETEEAEVTFSLNGPGSLLGPPIVMTERGVATILYQPGRSEKRRATPLQLVHKEPRRALITVAAPGLGSDSVSVKLIANAPPGAPVDLRCDGSVDPTGLPIGYPELTWTFDDLDSAKGDDQNAYQILIADNLADIQNDVGNLWDTGMVLSGGRSANPCGVPLQAGTLYYWKVKTWDLSGVPGPFSQIALFDLAPSLGYGVSLDPVAGTVNFGQHSSLDLQGSGGITIEMWIFRTEENRDSVILDKFVPFNGGGGWRVGIDASNHVYFRTKKEYGGDRRVTGIDATIEAGRWYHIAFCQTGAPQNDGVVYVDGTECGLNGLINVPWVVSEDLCLVQSGAVVDELRISDTLRYTGNFTPTAVPFVSDGYTVGLWHFDEGVGVTTGDESGNGNHGMITAGHGWGAGYLGR